MVFSVNKFKLLKINKLNYLQANSWFIQLLSFCRKYKFLTTHIPFCENVNKVFVYSALLHL